MFFEMLEGRALFSVLGSTSLIPAESIVNSAGLNTIYSVSTVIVSDYPAEPGKGTVVSDKLWSAIVQVESGGDASKVGDNGKSFGIVQIQQGVLDDINAQYGTNYNTNDCLDPVKSRQIMEDYLKMYGDKYTAKTGNPVTDEVLSRIWNGGPNGWKKNATLPYWHKVEKAMD